MNLNEQLGMYVAEYIIATQLPTLSCDLVQGAILIDVSPEDQDKHEELLKIFSSKEIGEEGREENFKQFIKYSKELAKKYLKDVLEIRVPRVEPSNMAKFKEGFDDAIWGCDYSHYIAEEDFFQQTPKGSWCSIIKLKLKIN